MRLLAASVAEAAEQTPATMPNPSTDDNDAFKSDTFKSDAVKSDAVKSDAAKGRCGIFEKL